MKILFADFTGVPPYTHQTLHEQAMSGTIASLIRVAEQLARTDDVIVAQPGRTEDVVLPGHAGYVGWDHRGRYPAGTDPDVVIMVKECRQAAPMRAAYPRARLMLWVPSIPGDTYRRHRGALVKADCTIVAVSDFQKSLFLDLFRGGPLTRWWRRPIPRVERVYYPIDDDLVPDDTPRDPDKLVFFSSPHKGLDQVLAALAAARKRRPTLRLALANPGYMALDLPNADDAIEVLGALPNHEVLRHVREAFCVFYPQTSFQETFGVVFAEANAVGTPVLSHPIGAAPEVLRGEGQLVDTRDPERTADRLMSWYTQGPPTVHARPEFRLSAVMAAWRQLLQQ